MSEKWIVTKPDDVVWYKVETERGRLIAYVPDQGNAHLIAQLPQLKELRYEWAAIINRLACLALDDEMSSNDRDDALEMKAMVLPYLSGVVYGEVK